MYVQCPACKTVSRLWITMSEADCALAGGAGEGGETTGSITEHRIAHQGRIVPAILRACKLSGERGRFPQT